MIEKLTSEQEFALVEFREQWLKIGRSTGASNLDIAIPIINDFYVRQGKTAPYIWRVNSPMMAQLIIHFLRANLYDNLRDNLSDNLSDNLYDNLSENPYDNLRDNLRDNLYANLYANLSETKIPYTPTWLWGAHDSYWIAFYLFVAQYVKTDIYSHENYDLLQQWSKLSESIFWWYPFDGICIISDRPESYGLDERGRLHSEDGMAMRFSDGYGFYAWHGVRVSADIILHPETITVERIENEANSEMRRVLREIYGEGRYLKDSGCEQVHQDVFGTLYTKVDNGEPIWMVEVENPTPEPDGTRRLYMLRIDPRAYGGDASRYAQAAIASTWRVGENRELVFNDWHDYVPMFAS